jgi:hypothetical protein
MDAVVYSCDFFNILFRYNFNGIAEKMIRSKRISSLHFLQVLILLGFVSIRAFAQTTPPTVPSGSVTGTVHDYDTHHPLRGVNVLLDSTALGATTNDSGYYTIKRVPPGRYRIKFSLVGMETTYRENMAVYADQTTRVDVSIRDMYAHLL